MVKVIIEYYYLIDQILSTPYDHPFFLATYYRR